MRRFTALLIALALIAGTVGCPAAPTAQYTLIISSTAGGSVTDPGEGAFTYGQSAVVNLLAEADEGYRFMNWTGDVGTVANVNAAATTISVNGEYSIRANFVAVHNLTITSTEGGSVTGPGEGTFTYDLGTVVNLTAQADEGYRFVSWNGDVSTIANTATAATTITISGDCSITATFEVEPTGAFLDEVVITRESSPAGAIQQLKNDALDLCAYGLTDAVLYEAVISDPNLTSVTSIGMFDEFTFNPVGPTFPATGKLNPFSDPQFREAMHWLIDREYIAEQIMGGLAVPRYTCLNPGRADAKERYSDLVAAIEADYGHNPGKARTVIMARMEALGAALDAGRWVYNGEPVDIIVLIRTEDERKGTGDYLATLLEGEGFTVTQRYGTAPELAPIWNGDPGRGVFHVYTGGWVTTVVRQDEGGNFGTFYTPLGSGYGPLWAAYQNDSVFYEAAEKLYNYDYADLEERRQLFEMCLEYSMMENQRMFLVARSAFTPMRKEVRLAYDLSGGVFGSWMWALTAHFVDNAGRPAEGGTLRIGTADFLLNPWNPVAGSNWVYDIFAIRATGDMGHWPDTRTGLRWPGRIEKAEVSVKRGLPVAVTNTAWCSLAFVPEVQVPLDAWADWDAVHQRFLTVQDRFGAGGTTAKTKSVCYYPKDIFAIPLHDGSTLSMGDFILYAVLQFDRAKPASPIYDESAVAAYNAFMGNFKGVKFITNNPDYGLIVEYYSDLWQLDAELIVTTMFPYYTQGPGMWHTIALAIRAEEDGALAFSGLKSGRLKVPWMSFIDEPSLPILAGYLDNAKAVNYIPYEPTMGQYVTGSEAAERWSNLERWYDERGHLWVASGPFYLESADTTNKVIHLKRFEDYPDPMDRWLFLLEPLP